MVGDLIPAINSVIADKGTMTLSLLVLWLFICKCVGLSPEPIRLSVRLPRLIVFFVVITFMFAIPSYLFF